MFVGLESCMWDLSEETKAYGCVEDREVGREATVKLSSPLSGTCILCISAC